MDIKLMNMCMIYNDDEVLVQDRKKKYWSGIGFPGGHVELNESLVDSVIREVKEETNLDIDDVEFCGFKTWDDERKNIVLLYKSKHYSGELKEYSEEGRNFWVKREELSSMNLALGFEDDLEVYFSNKTSEVNYQKTEEDKFESCIIQLVKED